MDDLKLLIEMVAKLPTLAVWVLVGYLIYKVVVVGSIYGLLRLAIEKLHSVMVQKKNGDVRAAIDGQVISSSMNALLGQIRRIAGKNTYMQSAYVHSQSVEWLKEAIDAKETLDATKPK
jgi:hypothetical protein